MEPSDVAQTIENLFENKGASLYGGEAVTQLEHALQAAELAEQSGGDAAAVAAALLHDVGHLLHDLPDDAPDEGVDDAHEELGYRWLLQSVGPAVAEPVRMHVDAKRYLCAVDPQYRLNLSPPSVQSLNLQGGPFTAEQARQFERDSYFARSIDLRRWDDLAKVAGKKTPNLRHFLKYVEQVCLCPAAVKSPT